MQLLQVATEAIQPINIISTSSTSATRASLNPHQSYGAHLTNCKIPTNTGTLPYLFLPQLVDP